MLKNTNINNNLPLQYNRRPKQYCQLHIHIQEQIKSKMSIRVN